MDNEKRIQELREGMEEIFRKTGIPFMEQAKRLSTTDKFKHEQGLLRRAARGVRYRPVNCFNSDWEIKNNCDFCSYRGGVKTKIGTEYFGACVNAEISG